VDVEKACGPLERAEGPLAVPLHALNHAAGAPDAIQELVRPALAGGGYFYCDLARGALYLLVELLESRVVHHGLSAA
jgi:hypothetical protein